MAILPQGLLRPLMARLGWAPSPLSDGRVRAILTRWIELDQGRICQGAPFSRPNEEPGWLLWCATVASKVERCPWHRLPEYELPWRGPAVGIAARVEAELDRCANELEERLRRARRMHSGREIVWCDSEARALTAARGVLGKLHASREYRRGMAQLAHEFAWCLQFDRGFSRPLETVAERRSW